MPVKTKKDSPSVSCTNDYFDALMKKMDNTQVAIKLEVEKFVKEGVKSSSSRARKYMQELRKMCQEGRVAIQARRNSEKK
jgi:hypothetical protein